MTTLSPNLQAWLHTEVALDSWEMDFCAPLSSCTWSPMKVFRPVNARNSSMRCYKAKIPECGCWQEVAIPFVTILFHNLPWCQEQKVVSSKALAENILDFERASCTPSRSDEGVNEHGNGTAAFQWIAWHRVKLLKCSTSNGPPGLSVPGYASVSTSSWKYIILNLRVFGIEKNTI